MEDENERNDIHSGRLSIPTRHKGDDKLGTFTEFDYYKWDGPEYSDKEKEHLKNLRSISNFKLILFVISLILVVLLVVIFTNKIEWG